MGRADEGPAGAEPGVGSGTTKPLLRIVMREYLESLLLAVLVALLLRTFVVVAYKIPTGSMVPTLKIGDFVFAYRLTYGVPVPFSGGERWAKSLPKRGDVIVFRFPGNDQINYIKRVIGLPGDRIAIKDKKLFVNETEAKYTDIQLDVIKDLPAHEYYLPSEESIVGSTHLVIRSRDQEEAFFGPVIVPPDHVFVLGDNRDSSDDSRYWGAVPFKNIEGRVFLVWMSMDWQNRWGDDRYPSIRWDRIFRVIN